MDNEIIFWELTAGQYALLADYFTDNEIALPTFEQYNGNYYLVQTPENLALYSSVFQDFDMDDGRIGDSYGTHTWTISTVPSVLWP